jgi:hypothetical protein
MASRYEAKVTLISVAKTMYYAGMGEPGGPFLINSDPILSDFGERLDSALTREFVHLRVEWVAEPAQRG